MPERSGREDNSEGAIDKAADRLKEAAGSLTGGKKDEGHTHVRAEGRDDRFRELEEAYKGYAVYDQHYEKIGKVDDLFVDESDQPEYIGVKMGYLLEQKTTLIPMGIVRINDRRKLIEVAADKDTIQEAPPFDNNKDITPEYEDRVHGYFGLERASSLPERGRYDDYYTSDLTGDHYADESLAGVDTEYGERAHSQGHPGVGIGDHTRGDLEQPSSQEDETAEPRSDVASTGEAARAEGTPPHDAEDQETASVRVHKRIR
jgi:PRC-barrel domain